MPSASTSSARSSLPSARSWTPISATASYCREELAGLAGLPALLGRVPLADAERLALGDEELEEAPAELLDALLAQVSARRRARRWRGITAAAAAAIIAVGGGGLAGGIADVAPACWPAQVAGQATSYLVRGSNPATHVTAAVYYSSATVGDQDAGAGHAASRTARTASSG